MNIEDAVKRIDNAIDRGSLAKEEFIYLDSHPMFSDSKNTYDKPNKKDSANPQFIKQYAMINHDNVYNTLRNLKELSYVRIPDINNYTSVKESLWHKKCATYSALAGSFGALTIGASGIYAGSIPAIMLGIGVAAAGAFLYYHHNIQSKDMEYNHDFIEYDADSAFYTSLAGAFNKANTQSFMKQIDSYIYSLDHFIEKCVPEKNYDKFDNIINNQIEINLFKKDLNKIITAIHNNNRSKKKKLDFSLPRKLFQKQTFVESDIQ